MMKVPEKYRIKTGPFPEFNTDETFGNNGVFKFDLPGRRVEAVVIVSDGLGWEHVSVTVSRAGVCSGSPTWEEMCIIKDMFWDEEDNVIQYHPPKSKYINSHPHCLHLWRPIGIEIPIPDPILIGINFRK